MFAFPYTGRADFDKATDEALEKLRQGKDREAMSQLATALADEPVAPEDEPAKRQAIADLRAAIDAPPKLLTWIVIDGGRSFEMTRSADSKTVWAQTHCVTCKTTMSSGEWFPVVEQAIEQSRLGMEAHEQEQHTPKRGQLYDMSVARFKAALDQVAPKANRKALRVAFTEFAATIKSEARASNAQALSEMLAEVGGAEDLHMAQLAVTAYATKVGVKLAAQSQSAKAGRTSTP